MNHSVSLFQAKYEGFNFAKKGRMMIKLFRILCVSLTCVSLAYSMDTTDQEKILEIKIARLKPSLAVFVNDFKTWPKEEQDKIIIHPTGLVIINPLAVSDKYCGSIGVFISKEMDAQGMESFFSVLDYIKKQK